MNTGKEKTSKPYHVRVVPPLRTIKMKRIWQEYSLIKKGYTAPIDFGIAELDLSKYAATIYERRAISRELSTKEIAADDLKQQMRFSAFSLAGEIARY